MPTITYDDTEQAKNEERYIELIRSRTEDNDRGASLTYMCNTLSSLGSEELSRIKEKLCKDDGPIEIWTDKNTARGAKPSFMRLR